MKLPSSIEEGAWRNKILGPRVGPPAWGRRAAGEGAAGEGAGDVLAGAVEDVLEAVGAAADLEGVGLIAHDEG